MSATTNDPDHTTRTNSRRHDMNDIDIDLDLDLDLDLEDHDTPFVPARQSLVDAVVECSVADDWRLARLEWAVADCIDGIHYPDADRICVCSQSGIRYLHSICNVNTGGHLGPIGSSCIEKFEVEAMTTAARQGVEMAKLRALVAEHVPLELKHLSRSSIAMLRDRGVLPEREAAFLRAMRDRRSPMTDRQAEWVDKILRRGNDSVRGQLTGGGQR